LSCKFRAGAVGKYLFCFTRPREVQPGAAFQDLQILSEILLRRSRDAVWGFKGDQIFEQCMAHIRTLYSRTLFLVLHIFYFYLHFCNYRGAFNPLYGTLEALESNRSIDRSIEIIKYCTLIIYNIDTTCIFNGFGGSILELMSCQKVKSYLFFNSE
jgi:hypothetical protein